MLPSKPAAATARFHSPFHNPWQYKQAVICFSMKKYISLAGFHLALLPFSVAEAVAAINNFTASSSPPPGLVFAWGAASAGGRGGLAHQIRIKDACFEAGSLPAEVASGCHQALATCGPELPAAPVSSLQPGCVKPHAAPAGWGWGQPLPTHSQPKAWRN